MAWQSWKKSGRFPTVLLLHCAVAESFAQSLERWKPQKQPAEEAYTVRILNVGKMRAMSSDPDDVVGANQYDLQNDVLLTVFRIRKIIILFTLSPVKNSLLQQEWGKKLTGFFEWQSTLKHTQKIIIERFFKDPKWEKWFYAYWSWDTCFQRGILWNCERNIKLLETGLISSWKSK